MQSPPATHAFTGVLLVRVVLAITFKPVAVIHEGVLVLTSKASAPSHSQPSGCIAGRDGRELSPKLARLYTQVYEGVSVATGTQQINPNRLRAESLKILMD